MQLDLIYFVNIIYCAINSNIHAYLSWPDENSRSTHFEILEYKPYILRIRYITINYFWMSCLLIYQTAVSLQHLWNAKKNYQKLCCLYIRQYDHLNFVSRLSS